MNTILYRLSFVLLTFLSVCSHAENVGTYSSVQKNMHYFDEALNNPHSYLKGRVRVNLSKNKVLASVWLSDVRKEAAYYVGTPSTALPAAFSEQRGQAVRVAAKDVLDWVYEDRTSRVIYGHFDLCTELDELPKEEAQEQREYWKLACLPAEK